MKYQVFHVFSLKNNEKYPRLLSAAVVIGALKVKIVKMLEEANKILFLYLFVVLCQWRFLLLFLCPQL